MQTRIKVQYAICGIIIISVFCLYAVRNMRQDRIIESSESWTNLPSVERRIRIEGWITLVDGYPCLFPERLDASQIAFTRDQSEKRDDVVIPQFVEIKGDFISVQPSGMQLRVELEGQFTPLGPSKHLIGFISDIRFIRIMEVVQLNVDNDATTDLFLQQQD